MGAEFKRKGVNVLLGPSIGPMGRVVRGGRNWESFSVDPYLTGALVRETVLGVQEAGVIASTKVRKLSLSLILPFYTSFGVLSYPGDVLPGIWLIQRRAAFHRKRAGNPSHAETAPRSRVLQH